MPLPPGRFRLQNKVKIDLDVQAKMDSIII